MESQYLTVPSGETAIQEGTLSGSEQKTATRSDLWAKSLGGRVSSCDLGDEMEMDFLEGVEVVVALVVLGYFQMTSWRPHTNQAHPSFDNVTLHSVFPGNVEDKDEQMSQSRYYFAPVRAR